MDNYKLLDKHFKKKKGHSEGKKLVFSYLNKTLIVIALFLGVLITVKIKPSFKEAIKKHLYDDNLSFATFNSFYDKYLGGVLPFKKSDGTKTVFNEKLEYKEVSLYKDGCKLKVSTNYLVPLLESGIVVFIGDKELYGKTVIVQQVDGVEVWYGNINVSDIELYDYVDKGDLIGEAKDDTLYLVFQKDGKFLDYKEYLK